MSSYLTNANVDAVLLSARAGGRIDHADWTMAYTIGWNLSDDVPLAEVAPFMAGVTYRPPLGGGFEGLVRAEMATAQGRVDPILHESSTPSWGRLDLGARWRSRSSLTVALELVNLTDALYGGHLSYLRDPFAGGVRVMEPGRTLRLSIAAGP
jgi:outer membrane receptor protein involved in Fe transport